MLSLLLASPGSSRDANEGGESQDEVVAKGLGVAEEGGGERGAPGRVGDALPLPSPLCGGVRMWDANEWNGMRVNE